jgi:hypothetical protein
VDEQSLAEFAEDLENNLYKLWNRLAFGSWMPPPVKRVEIPKAFAKRSEAGGCSCAATRTLTIWHRCSTRSSAAGLTTSVPSTSRHCIRPCCTSTATWPAGQHASSNVCAAIDGGPSNGCAVLSAASPDFLPTGACSTGRLDRRSRMSGDVHVRLCVQENLACSVGVSPTKREVRFL